MRWCWSSRQPLSNGIATGSDCTGAGDHAVRATQNRNRDPCFDPTQDWLSGQMTEAFPWDTAARYPLRDRDQSYGPAFRHRVRAMGITEVITARRSPWQNACAA